MTDAKQKNWPQNAMPPSKHPSMLSIVTRDRDGHDDVMRKSPIADFGPVCAQRAADIWSNGGRELDFPLSSCCYADRPLIAHGAAIFHNEDAWFDFLPR